MTGRKERKPIVRGETLRLNDFMERAELGRWAWGNLHRDAAQIGIQLASRVGRNVYVNCDRFLEYLERKPVTPPTGIPDPPE